jgi:hypothetical protein
VPIAVLYSHRGRLREEKRHAFDIGAGHKISRVVLRILRKLDPAEVNRVTRAALKNIAGFSDRGELVRLVGHRKDSGHKLVTEADAQLIESAFFDDVLASDVAQLSSERDLMHLLFWMHSQRPEDATDLMFRMTASDEPLFRLLRAALVEVVGHTDGDAAVRRSYQLGWVSLTELLPEDRLVERVKQLDLTQLPSDADARMTRAVEEAQRYADNPAAAREDQSHWAQLG